MCKRFILLVFAVVFAAIPCAAQTGTPIATPIFTGFDASGNACASCKLYAFETGASTTPLDTYTTAALSVANANPVVLSSAGTATVFTIPGRTYRFRLDTAADVVLWTVDGVAGLQAVTMARLRLEEFTATIATGAISVTGSNYEVDTESAGATDELDTINITAGSGIGSGSLLTLRPANVSRVVTVTDSVGNIELSGGDYALSAVNRSLTLMYDGSQWVEVARASTDVTDIASCDGRLTLSSGDPVTASDQTAATTMYFAPYKGNRCALYDGTSWTTYTFTERSLALGTLTDDLPYDVFLYNNSGTLTLEFTAWTSGTARATALTTQNGVYVRSGATTRRYLGTFRTETTTTTEDSFAKRFVWNYYNRIPKAVRVADSTASWAYTTATFRQARATATNQVAIVVGLQESPLSLTTATQLSNTNTGVIISVGIGENSTSAVATGGAVADFSTALAGGVIAVIAQLTTFPAIGYSYYAMLERSAATGTTTWYGAAQASGNATVMSGTWFC